jgi:hypothetical protein
VYLEAWITVSEKFEVLEVILFDVGGNDFQGEEVADHVVDGLILL